MLCERGPLDETGLTPQDMNSVKGRALLFLSASETLSGFKKLDEGMVEHYEARKEFLLWLLSPSILEYLDMIKKLNQMHDTPLRIPTPLEVILPKTIEDYVLKRW